MMPLWITETLPALCGWALASLGRPCVAQRVCPIPSVPAGASRATIASSPASLPRQRRTCVPWPLTMATPAES